MVVFAYVCRHDLGSAPNVSGGWLTLATCKPSIRRAAIPGDCIIGFQQKSGPVPIFMCRVDHKMNWSQYVGTCEQTLHTKLRSARHPLGDCYLDMKGKRRKECDRSYHKKAEAMQKDWQSPVLLSSTYIYWGDGTQNARLPPCPWLKDLIQEWWNTCKTWRGHRNLTKCQFPHTEQKIRLWAARWGPAKQPSLWKGTHQGEPLNVKKN